MWFKTRVGLTGFGTGTPIDILVGDGTIKDTEERRWWIYARIMLQQDGEAKSILGNAKWLNPSLYLAMFAENENTQKAIGECMGLIEKAMQSGAIVCDLSGVGDASAWSENWKQVQWQ